MSSTSWQGTVRVWFIPVFAFLVFAVAMAVPVTAQQTPLDHYVAQEDTSYRWELVRTHRSEGLTTLVIDMKSQRWRTAAEVDRPLWQHWLLVAKPDRVRSKTGLLFISGGSNGGPPPSGPNERIATLARESRSVVAALMMVPNQPLTFHNDGQARTEDDLIAYTWIQYFKTGDPSWPARNPMVKSAVRAMDTITAVLASKQGGQVPVDQFVVAGASKRGWTTWLTGAVDSRVVAIAPIVIDVLNMEQSMRHHYAAYGFWAPAVGDYVEHKIFEYLGTPRMEKLQRLVDPYYYRHRLTMPKFVLNASGDQFFLPDSSRFYFSDLPGDKYLCYVPNADHSLEQSDALNSLLAFYLTVLEQKPRPEIRWSFQDDGAIRVSTRETPEQVVLWQATNPKARDFRVETLGKRYRSSVLKDHGDGTYIARVPEPEQGWTAFFVEVAFDLGLGVPFKQTTSVRVLPDVLPFADKELAP